jgi:O-acetylhomoserine/O-acetylserine sulfhydrylase-like pyridoxal-dependent enzyme
VFADLAARHGITVSYISGRDAAELTAAVRPASRLLYLETIANPTAAVSDLPGGRAAGLAFAEAVRLAALAPSLGGAETLVLHPASTSHRQLSAAELAAAGVSEGSIRVSGGLEHPDDLWADFAQALAATSASSAS